MKTCQSCGYVHEEQGCPSCKSMRSRLRYKAKVKAAGKSYRVRKSKVDDFAEAAYSAWLERRKAKKKATNA